MYKKINEILVWLCKLIYRDEDEEILIETLWAFSYLTEGNEDVVREVLRTGVARRITDSLLHTRVVSYKNITIKIINFVFNFIAPV